MPPKRGFVAENLWSLRSVSDPQVSPDGSRVAFVVGTPNKETDKQATRIWVAPADGSSPAKAFTAGPEDSAPRWSPDGRWLAFCGRGTPRCGASIAPRPPGRRRGRRSNRNAIWGLATCLVARWQPLPSSPRPGSGRSPTNATPSRRTSHRVVTGLYSRYDGTGWFDSPAEPPFTSWGSAATRGGR